jgi:predicted DNA-binding WGR domain protein
MANDVWVNILDNHFKVWGFDCFSQDNGEATVTTYWGKIGLPMQRLNSKTKPFPSYADAYDYIMLKIREKDAKGYKRIPNHRYFEYTYSDKPLSELVALIESIE